MRIPVLTLTLILLAAAAAGCIGTDPEPVDTATTPEDSAPSEEVEETEDPEPQEAPEDPEPQEEEQAEEEAEDEEAPPAPRIVEMTASGSTMLLVGRPCDDLDTECGVGITPTDGTFEGIAAGARSATLVATWSATLPELFPSYFEVRDAEGTLLAKGSGTATVTIDVPTDLLVGDITVSAKPEWGQAHVDQSFDYVLTLEYP